MDKYKDIRIVIPGHGNYGGEEILTHTIKLVKEERKK
jgi:metallo-beta-lactamase class B